MSLIRNDFKIIIKILLKNLFCTLYLLCQLDNKGDL